MAFQPVREPFCLPVNVARLRTDRLRLAPFEDNYERNVQELLKASVDHDELFTYLGYGPFKHAEEYHKFWSATMSKKSIQLFAIILAEGTIKKRAPGSDEYTEHEVKNDTFAGVMSLLNCDLNNSVAEIGHIMILPQYQRTFVNSTAICLLLNHLLEPQPQDLGLRRVEWRCHSLNEPSKAAARRFGFKLEGVLRWFLALPIGKKGNSGDRMPTTNARGENIGLGRHTCIFAICWDDWLNGSREHIFELLQR